jgi:hypothetical protein
MSIKWRPVRKERLLFIGSTSLFIVKLRPVVHKSVGDSFLLKKRSLEHH